MKLGTISALFAAAGCLSAGVASAAVCGPEVAPYQGVINNTTGILGANSCGHNTNFNNTSFCSGVSFSPAGTDVYELVLGASQSFTVTATSPAAGGGQAFFPNVGILGQCQDNGTCVADRSTDGASTTLPATGNISGHAAATYFLIITDSTGGGNGCGTYDLSFTGNLPVKLEKFSVD